MKASHESLRDDYEVSCPELDAMAEACRCQRLVRAPESTGGGFGGACVALVEITETKEFVANSNKYIRREWNGMKGVILFARRPMERRLGSCRARRDA